MVQNNGFKSQCILFSMVNSGEEQMVGMDRITTVRQENDALYSLLAKFRVMVENVIADVKDWGVCGDQIRIPVGDDSKVEEIPSEYTICPFPSVLSSSEKSKIWKVVGRESTWGGKEMWNSGAQQ
jgi:hypothetical protein